ncbi:hypothetical protein Slin15195_G017860 [Septoria linicola]|uniref:Uncharacterized protein n=1 Tax=Septoria linicola TaxID=215465 RepID=A0A9Q9EG75_9PEZI|nr:hypothetical protein Slin15195_G017860 [Septoria linicola]
MSTDRNNRPLKPTLASTRTATSRTPLTPRIAGSAATSTPATTRPAAPRVAGRTPLLSPRVRAQDTQAKETTSNGNVTPRSSARRSRIGVDSGQSSPAYDDTPTDAKSRGGLAPGDASNGRNSTISGLSLGPGLGMSSKSRPSRPNSVVTENKAKGGRSPPLVRSPGISDFGQVSGNDTFKTRFFHASDAKKQEPAPKRPEPKKPPTFFYADGNQDRTASPPKPSSPVLSAVGERRAQGPFIKAETNPTKSPLMLSPAFNQSSASLSYFPPTVPLTPLRSPSPSKENIHLSYRKGASQIFGMRPAPRITPSVTDLMGPHVVHEGRRPSRTLAHRKSSSLSSLNSGNEQLRRISNTALEDTIPSSPLTHELHTTSIPRITSPATELPSIDTSLTSSVIVGSPPESALSPTKTVTQLAADARRERKVLDLEISNSSLLAINASLERELRRQKAELKRFRRLSRAGRLSSAAFTLPRSVSSNLDTLGEEDDDDDDLRDTLDGWDEEDASESEDDSLGSGSDARSASASSDRLAKDEKRLKVDLERHRELLVQSQAMNQSLKRCMYATDEMIRDGKKALEYHVRVSDVKLGGRILSGHDDDEEDATQDLIVDDDELGDAHGGGMENAKGLLDVWRGVGRPLFEGSEGSGDRDSGIEVDKPYGLVSARYSDASNTTGDSGRPPEHT